MAVQKIAYSKSVEYLRQLGLSTDESLAYLYLLEHGPQTVLMLSRGLATGRTKLYPLLEALADRQLVTVHERHYGTSYEASSPENIEFLIEKRERTVHNLRSELPTALHHFKELRQKSPAISKIIEYTGAEGIKDMYWNMGRSASREVRIFRHKDTARHLGKHFLDKIGALSDKNKLILDNRKAQADSRYLDRKLLPIEQELLTYDHIVGIINFNEGKVHGVEIHNTLFALSQRQYFDYFWKQA